MASLFGTYLVAACVSVQGQYHEACNKALDAGTRQVGIRQQVDNAEDKSLQLVNAKAENTIGKDGMWVVGSGFFVYKTARDKSLDFKLPTLGLCNSVTNHVTADSYNIKLNWNF